MKKPLLLRLPIRLVSDVEKLAKQKKRSVNNYVEVLLTAHVERKTRKKTVAA